MQIHTHRETVKHRQNHTQTSQVMTWEKNCKKEGTVWYRVREGRRTMYYKHVYNFRTKLDTYITYAKYNMFKI